LAEQILQKLPRRLKNLLSTTYKSASHTPVTAIADRATKLMKQGLIEIAWMDTGGIKIDSPLGPQNPSTPRLRLYRLKDSSSTGASDAVVTEA
jgi:hypothetical protein